jgi:hypothetical protein
MYPLLKKNYETPKTISFRPYFNNADTEKRLKSALSRLTERIKNSSNERVKLDKLRSKYSDSFSE